MKRNQKRRLEVSRGKADAAKLAQLPNRARKEMSALAELSPRTGIPLTPKEVAIFRKIRGVDKNGRGRVTVGTKGRQEKYK